MNSRTNPKGIIKQMLNNSTPENISNMLGRARQMGVPDNILSQIQNF